ncbi:hypothetical protein H312_02376 [Anncaliia algerae PRA339]|uniref:ISXO2-like transposase domain-containing protein n=1 Tax=Anncaliia algerae PRA339 TaxID=1288291 RepID=A0A059EZS6_9MICR|nr:hypothetical protein H312_02376 [Anncaliia algerae PRA339]
MYSADLDTLLTRMSKAELIQYLRQKNLLMKELKCETCKQYLVEESCAYFKDEQCFRCYTTDCNDYIKRISIRSNSFFADFSCDLLVVLKVLILFSFDIQRHNIFKKKIASFTLIDKIFDKLHEYLRDDILKMSKMGGHGAFVQVDETMLNYKCKSHRGRSALNKTDALCIVEVSNSITKAYATIIPNKEASTIIPIICDKVVNGTLIYTDEHRSYASLAQKGYVHQTVCHKYNFVDKISGAHTQFVESFNNELKLDIKKRKGVETNLRSKFLEIFIWKFNNKNNRIGKIFDLIKI